MPKRRVEVRCEYFKGTNAPVVTIDDEEESILTANHEGGEWWVYIERWVDDD
jgi:hypothetical protein